MRIVVIALCFIVVACSGNPVSSISIDLTLTGDSDTQGRAAVVQQSPQIALLQIQQGFNDLDQYIVYGKIKNISESGISGIQVKATLYKEDGTLLSSKSEYPDYWLGDLQPRGETAFSVKFYWWLDLDRQIPESTRTVVDILIDGYKVSYDNRTELPYQNQFDFRFSNWGDDEETVSSNEPNWLYLDHIAGGKATKESLGFATAVLEFSDVLRDTVEVVYEFQGGLLVSGRYDFAMTVPATRMDTIRTELNERYGPGTQTDNSWSWDKGTHTWVFLFPATTWRGIRIAYVDVNRKLDTEAEDDYNRLPLRVAVPE